MPASGPEEPLSVASCISMTWVNTLVLTTVNEDGAAIDRVLQSLDSDGQRYVCREPALAARAGPSGRRECAVRAVKIGGIVLVSYVLIVVAFESLIGYFQPEAGDTLVLTTVNEDGAAIDRVLQSLDSDGWPSITGPAPGTVAPW